MGALVSLAVCLGVKSVRAAPQTGLEPVKIIPVVWGQIDPEVRAVIPHFYDDFTSKLIPTGYTQALAEYGVGQHISWPGNSFDIGFVTGWPYDVTAVSSLNASGIESPEDVRLMFTQTLPGTLYGTPILPDPACPVPSAGQTESFSNLLYVVHVPPGITLLDEQFKADVCGYHDTMTVQEVSGSQIYNCTFAWAIMEECGDGDVVTTTGIHPGTINEYTTVLSHELIEAIVDPWSNRMTPDPQNPNKEVHLEVGDICK
ncbi:MAG: hypothetical protein ACREJ3_20430, partial [Polyangiaceae bacterium]